MAGMKVLLNQARRHCLTKSHCHLRPPFSKFISSESNAIPNPKPESVPIQPVSYSIKPKDNQTETPPPPPQKDSATSPIWTREDIRYLKDSPQSISPVSYPTRIAPLPEYSVAAPGGEEDKEREKGTAESVNPPRPRAFRRLVEEQQEEEQVKVPFPSLIKIQNKDKKPPLDLTEALKLVKANAKRNFDETIEAHVRLGITQSRSDLIVRGTMTLPHGASKAVRIAVFAEGADADEARDAGADIVGGVELIEEIASAGKINFEKCFSTQQFMPRLFKISKILNKHGLMPNPKLGTVTSDFSRAVKEAQKNQVKFRMDKSAIVHVGLGKVSLPDAALRENISAFMNAVLLAKPAGLKKTSKYAGYVNSVHICSTMGPGFPVSIQSLSKAVDQYNKMLLN
ncbi:Ribosomal_L1 domain-containing protein [Cephalotus follicularis]|uniref:Large ribosomal subunit protein uL1c n=1 Tax=Cephalotus follicularis TaxID=3775 RepID=A0A1Q3AZ70_CEPFO|nr:Ribosomal_L1 domain-containing protein [Cephalotus follicularis]